MFGKTVTSSYRPNGDGSVERVVPTLTNVLAMVVVNERRDD